MYYVYFVRDLTDEVTVAKCRTCAAAILRADEEFELGSRNVEVYNDAGEVIYEPEKDNILVDEF